MRFLSAFAPAVCAVLVAFPAMAQNNDMRAVMSRLDQMQRQMDMVSRQVYRGEAPPEGAVSRQIPSETAGLAAAMDDRMNTIEGTLRQLTNRLDEQDYAVGQLKQQFDLFKSDAEMRLQEMATKQMQAPAAQTGNAPVITNLQNNNGTAASESAAASAETNDLPNDNAAALYDAAFQSLREQKYERAEAAFKSFLDRYSSDTLAGNAQYWLGETFYVRGNYQEAAKIFAQGFQKYPKSSKAPDNLLKLGLSLAQNGKTKEACLTLDQLGVRYPNAAAVIKQRAVDETKKLNCGKAQN